MIKALKPLILLFILCCAGTRLSAQHTFELSNVSRLKTYQDSLQRMSDATYNASNDQERLFANSQFIKTLVTALKTPASFNFPFDSLKRISVLKSPNNTLRIFSWYVPADDGSYRFYGAIQMATKDGKLKMFPLIDDTNNMKDVNQITGNKNWYGARYYQVIPIVMNGRAPYYILLGWKGNNAKTSKKVIDILSFDKADQPVFGKTIFDGLKGETIKNRIVFEYNKLNSMTLTLDRSVNMIVFDHLAPFSAEMQGNFEFYASDLSFDAYKIVGGRLKLVENVEMKNEPNAMDDFYIDPKDKQIKAEKKL
ncbi:hypothetical protein FBD94_04070 [Pedobacter hiemivivus]|uniref:DUF1571 domain-containing protein n=1 Tax=Pedobacter hiemivivus TaxID=2530454 RepID=A0A4V5PD68_9SPHI|nr:hypothetical protein [Pedobacter hiemivivus]TKC63546.1 hypothetical protein FBD94_04070 [Pedobacter hiemivivus]